MRVKSKLTYQFTLIVASILLCFSLAIYFFSSTYRKQEFKKRLMDKGRTTVRLLIKVDEVDMKLLRIIDRNNLTALQNEKITVYNHYYQKLYSSDDDPEIPASEQLFRDISENSQVFFSHGDNEAVGLLSREKNDRFFVIVSAYDRFGINKLRNLRLILSVGFIISMGAVFMAGWIFSGQAIRPISDIVNQMKDISASNLHLRIDQGNGQDEIAQLAIQFNQMLERLEQAFEMQKNFVSNASHELRTPLSTIHTQLEITLAHERSKEEYRNIIESVLEDINSLITLSNGLLDLAHAGSDFTGSMFKKIRLDELLYQCISDIAKKYPVRKVNLNIEESVEEEHMFIISANESLLRTAFMNLLDNACKYSEDQIMVTIGYNENNILISIMDTGTGIRAGEINHIFDPFYRGSNAKKISGHGIGLPLSRKIIQLHKGKIDLVSKVSEGTTVLVKLPV